MSEEERQQDHEARPDLNRPPYTKYEQKYADEQKEKDEQGKNKIRELKEGLASDSNPNLTGGDQGKYPAAQPNMTDTQQRINKSLEGKTGVDLIQAERKIPETLNPKTDPDQQGENKPFDAEEAQERVTAAKNNKAHTSSIIDEKHKRLVLLDPNAPDTPENRGPHYKDYPLTPQGRGMFIEDMGGDDKGKQELSATPATAKPKFVGGNSGPENRQTESGRPRGMKMDAMSRWMLEQRNNSIEGAKKTSQDPDAEFDSKLLEKGKELGIEDRLMRNPSLTNDPAMRAKINAARAAVASEMGVDGSNTEGMDQETVNEMNKGLAHYLGRSIKAKKDDGTDKYSQNDLNAIVGEHVAATGDSKAQRRERANIEGKLDTPEARRGDGIIEGKGPRYKNVKNPNTGEWELQMTQEREDERMTRRARTMLKEHIKNHPEDFTGPDGQLDEGKMRQFMEEHGAFQGNQDYEEGDGDNLTKVFGTTSELNRTQRQANQSAEHIRQRNLQGKDQLLRGPYHGAAHYNDQMSQILETGDYDSAFMLARRMGDQATMDYIAKQMDNRAAVEVATASNPPKLKDDEPFDPKDPNAVWKKINEIPTVDGRIAAMMASPHFANVFPADLDLNTPEGNAEAHGILLDQEVQHLGKPVTSADLKDNKIISDSVDAYADAYEATPAYEGIQALMNTVQNWFSENPGTELPEDLRAKSEAALTQFLGVMAKRLGVSLDNNDVMSSLAARWYARQKEKFGLPYENVDQFLGGGKAQESPEGTPPPADGEEKPAITEPDEEKPADDTPRSEENLPEIPKSPGKRRRGRKNPPIQRGETQQRSK